jgi:Ca-activated chloride channel family protein
MTRLLLFSAVAALALTVHLSAQQPVFRSGSETVNVYATVTDDERLVTNLTRENFQVFDNGKAQTITVFDNSPQPIRLIVLIDVSGSMLGNLPLLRDSAEALFTNLGPNDLAKVGTFGKDVVIGPTFTRDVGELMAALPTEIPQNASTPLWRAADQAVTELENADGRPVVLILSDGRDSMTGRWGQRIVTQLEVAEHANAEEVMIYSIGLRSRGGTMMPRAGADIGAMMAADLPDPGLGRIALDTGGGYFELRPRDNLRTAFARVMEELHSQYLLGFSPTVKDGKRHRLEVKVNVGGLKPRARKNYVAPRETSN